MLPPAGVSAPAAYSLAGGACLVVRYGLAQAAGLGLSHATPNVHYEPTTRTACVFTGAWVLCCAAGWAALSRELAMPVRPAHRTASRHTTPLTHRVLVQTACDPPPAAPASRRAALLALSGPFTPTHLVAHPCCPPCVAGHLQNLDELVDRHSSETFAEGPTSPSSVLAGRGDPRQLAAETLLHMYIKERQAGGDLLLLLSELQVRGAAGRRGCCVLGCTALCWVLG